MAELHLLGKKINIEDSPVLFKYSPDENWKNYFDVKGGEWEYKGGCLIGAERGNKGGILFTKDSYEDGTMMTFKVSTVLPATRDLNAVFCAEWDEKTDYLGESYVCGLNGWYEHKSGIERNGKSCLNATTTLYKYTPGEEVTIRCGSINGHSFMTVDDVLVSEVIDPDPLRGGYFGFSPYCTKLKIRDIVIQKIAWEEFPQTYDPEF